MYESYVSAGTSTPIPGMVDILTKRQISSIYAPLITKVWCQRNQCVIGFKQLPQKRSNSPPSSNPPNNFSGGNYAIAFPCSSSGPVYIFGCAFFNSSSSFPGRSRKITSGVSVASHLACQGSDRKPGAPYHY